MFKNMKLGTKIIAGYLLVIAFVGITGAVGYWGTKTVARSLYVVGNEEAPVVDMANEMKISMWEARNTLEEFKGASAALATDNADSLDEIVAHYEQTVADFDTFADAILEGKTLEDGTVVIKTDNDQLANLVRQSDDVHNDKFQVAAADMIKAGRALLARKAEAEAAMVAMEVSSNAVAEGADQLETGIKEIIAAKQGEAEQMGDLEELLQQWVPYVDCAMELKGAISNSRIALEETAQMTELAEVDQLERRFVETVNDFDEIVVAMQEGGSVDGDRIFKVENRDLLAKIAAFDEEHDTFQQACSTMFTAQRAMIVQANKANLAMEALDAAGDETVGLLDKVETAAGKEMTAAKDAGVAAVTVSITWIIVTLLAAVAIGMVTGIVITRGITQPFRNMFKGLKSFSTGELQETGQQFREIIGSLNTGSEQTSSAASQVSGASQSLAQGSSEQAAAVEEFTSSIEEMSSMTKQNAGNAAEAKTLAAAARESAGKGSDSMTRMSQAIDDIKKSSDETAKIVKTIDEIAFQTNLLALNAAVEAARAGEAGKGFAVVAEEVRNLAQRSAEAARNTADMIEGSVKNADNGVQISQEVSKSLEEIAVGSQKVNDLVAEIAAASNEQSQGIEQIGAAVGQMNQVTQSNAANAEESASASEELSTQAEEINNVVDQLRILVYGAEATKRSTSTAKQARKHLAFQADHSAADRVHNMLHKGGKTGSKKGRPSASPKHHAVSASAVKANDTNPGDLIPMDDDKELSKF